jgi:hypothetical protein
MDDDGLPKGIRNRNDVGKPPKQSKSTSRAPLKTAKTTATIAVAIAIISMIISTVAWIYQHH